jgi:hypothetical protein
MHRRIALTLAVACSAPALAQETATPPGPVVTEPAPSSAPLTTQGPPAASPAPLTIQAPAGKPAGGATNDPPEIIVDPEGPGTDHGESSRVRLPPPGPGREAFLRDFLRVDPKSNTPFVGNKEMSASDFYGRIGRPDLVAASDGQTRKRIWLMAAATLVTAAGVGAGVLVLSNAQSLNDPACFVNGNTSYNTCVDRNHQTTLIGGLIIAGAVAAGGGVLTWALTTQEMVTPSKETVRLATEYNRNLAVRHGAPAGATLQLLPSIGPQGASLSARLTF